MTHWYLDVLKKYAVFDGRARREEFWWFFLFHMIALFVLGFIDGMLGLPSVLSGIYFLGTLVPYVGVGIRRLHDTGRSGWWMLLAIVPIVSLVLLVFFIFDSQPGENQYGPNPKGL